jgi:hypothetical protein
MEYKMAKLQTQDDILDPQVMGIEKEAVKATLTNVTDVVKDLTNLTFMKVDMVRSLNTVFVANVDHTFTAFKVDKDLYDNTAYYCVVLDGVKVVAFPKELFVLFFKVVPK